MRDHATWSLSLGRWGGVRVRLHALFLLFAVMTLYITWVERSPSSDDSTIWLGILSLLILLASVTLHELAHCHAAYRVGAEVDEIVLGPFGGLLPIQVQRQPQHELYVILAGPLINLVICLVCAPVIVLAMEINLFGLLHPLQPIGLSTDDRALNQAIKLAFWINWLLFIINVLPAFPMDGGRALRAAIVSVAPDFGHHNAVQLVAGIAKLAALGMLVAAWLVRDSGSAGMVPTWFALILLAMVLFFSARQEAARIEDLHQDKVPFGYDFSQGYTSLERSEESVPPPPKRPGVIARWLSRCREDRLLRQQHREEDDDRRMDEILSRLNATGMRSLSSADRDLLNRVSARYRSRMDQ